MADAKFTRYSDLGGGTTVIPDNTSTALDIESTDAKDYITANTTDGSESITLGQKTIVTGGTATGNIAQAPTDADSFIIDTTPDGGMTIVGESNDPMKIAFVTGATANQSYVEAKAGTSSANQYVALATNNIERFKINGSGQVETPSGLHTIGALGTALNGTFTATNGSAEITSGSSTAFRTELHVGSAVELFEGSTSRGVFTVSAIASDTALTLDSTVSGLSSSPKAGMTGKTDGDELFAVKTGDSKSILAVTGEGGLVLNSSAADSGIYNNLAIGDSDILSKATTANRNYIIGHSNGDWDLTSADSCTIMGYNAGVQVTSGSNNTVIGAYSGDSISTQTGITCLGTGAGRTTGSYSTYIGANSGAAVSSNGNTAVGYDTMKVSGPQYGVAMGQQAHMGCTGTRNVAIGVNALKASGSASSCVAIGYEAAKLATGGGNVCIGYNSGDAITSGVQNTSLGNDTDCSATNNNQLALGYGAVTDGANKIRLGNSSIGTANIQVDWTIDSDERIKENIQDADAGLDFINALRPVSFTRKHPAEWPEEIRDRRYKQGKKESNFTTDEDGNITGEVEYYVSTETYDVDTQEPIKDEFDSTSRVDGLIAQEVKSVVESLGVGFHGIDEAANGKLGIQYSTLVVPLIKAVQELTARIEQLESGS